MELARDIETNDYRMKKEFRYLDWFESQAKEADLDFDMAENHLAAEDDDDGQPSKKKRKKEKQEEEEKQNDGRRRKNQMERELGVSVNVFLVSLSNQSLSRISLASTTFTIATTFPFPPYSLSNRN